MTKLCECMRVVEQILFFNNFAVYTLSFECVCVHESMP